MSNSLINVQQILFDELVKLQYQSLGFRLRDTMRMRSGVIGNQVQFRKVGQVIAQPTAYQNTIAIQDPGFLAETATLVKYAAGTAVDSIEELTVNFDVKRELALVVSAAIGRRSDQVSIDALNASGTSNTIAVNYGGGANTNMTYAKLRAMIAYFEELAIPPQERYLAMTGNNLAALLNDDQMISNRYTDNYAVVRGTLNESNVMGCNIRIIPTMPEGGLPISGNTRTCFAWHKEALGFAIGQDMRIEINYLPREVSWFVNGLFFAGATTIDNLGVINIACDETVTG